MAAAFADALEGGAAEAVVGGEVLLQALLDGGIGEVLVGCGASAYNLGSGICFHSSAHGAKEMRLTLMSFEVM